MFVVKREPCPRRKMGGDTEYRPRASAPIRRCVDFVRKVLCRQDLVKMSKLMHRRKTVVPTDFRKKLHHAIRNIPLLTAPSDHTHPDAARYRTSVASRIEEVILNAGFRPYSVSMSKRDKFDGCRYYFMQRDYDKEFRDDPVTSDNVIMMIDVDYYVDFNRYLQYGNPVMIYTFVPTSAGGPTTDGTFSIENDEIVYRVSGGATYRHQVWDHNHDFVSVKDKHGNLLTYVVEQHTCEFDPQRRIIGYYPVTSVPAHCFVKPSELGVKRLKFTSDNMNSVRDIVSNTISVACHGSPHSVTIPINLFDAIKIRHDRATKPVIADVERLLQAAEPKVPQASTKAPILFELLNAKPSADIGATSSIPPAKTFQTLKPLATEDGKPCGRAVAPPLTTAPAVLPARGVNNDHATIIGRVVKTRNTTLPPHEWKKYDDELVNHLVPRAGIGVPWSIERVVEVQDRPTQRGRSERAMPSLTQNYANKVKAFIKAEPYNNITDPRNISTVDNAHQLTYSTFTYAFKEDVLKHQKWFASAMKPGQICDRLRDICEYRHGVIVSDYSRLDGHISQADKNFKRRVYMRWCRVEDRTTLSRVLNQDSNVRGTTSTGVRYDPGTSQLSGSPGTTNDNNLVTLRHDYIALRELGHSAKESWKLINKWVLGASDDRLRAALPGLGESLERVTSLLGHKMESVHFSFGSAILYLGRHYPNPQLYRTSMQDPIRTLAKLHLTTAPNSTTERDALYHRATGYLVTDRKTPIIGTWCAKVLQLLDKPTSDPTRDEQFRIDQGPWPQEECEPLKELMCALLNLDASELEDIERLIETATSIEELPNGVLNTDHLVKHKIQAAVGHDLLGPAPPVDEPIPCLTIPKRTKTSSEPETPGSESSSATCDNQQSLPSQSTATTAPMESSVDLITSDSTTPSMKSSQRSRKAKSTRQQHPSVSIPPNDQNATQTAAPATTTTNRKSSQPIRRRPRRRPAAKTSQATPPAPPQAAAPRSN